MFDKMDYYLISVYVPESHQELVQKAMADAGAGRLGNYDSCAATYPVTGYWRPLGGAHPLIGEIDNLSNEPEVKIEAICPREAIQAILKAIRSVHPYEVPVISVLPLVNQLFE